MTLLYHINTCKVLLMMSSSERDGSERLSEFIRINVCRRLIQGAAKRLGVFLPGVEKGAENTEKRGINE